MFSISAICLLHLLHLLRLPPSEGLISAPVNVKVPLWSSGFSIALEAREKLMAIINDKLKEDTQG